MSDVEKAVLAVVAGFAIYAMFSYIMSPRVMPKPDVVAESKLI